MHFSVPAPPSDVNGCQEAPKSIEVETTVRPSVGVQLAVQTGIAWHSRQVCRWRTERVASSVTVTMSRHRPSFARQRSPARSG